MPKESYQKISHRLERFQSPSARSWNEDNFRGIKEFLTEQIIDCGWGRLIFGHTFSNPAKLATTLREEKKGERDIALYVQEPHVVVAKAPQEIFLDPSDTYRLRLAQYRPQKKHNRPFNIRRLRSIADAEAIKRVCIACHMVPADPQFIWKNEAPTH